MFGVYGWMIFGMDDERSRGEVVMLEWFLVCMWIEYVV